MHFTVKRLEIFIFPALLIFLRKILQMKIRILLFAILCSLMSFVTEAQKSDAEAEAVANLLGIQKKEAVRRLIHIDAKDSAAFWKVYEQYQADNQKTIKDRIQLYEGTANAYNSLTPPVADSLATKYFFNRKSQEKMLEDYYKKIKSATNAVTAFEFYQAETYLLTQIRAHIMQQIPTYGELMNVKK